MTTIRNKLFDATRTALRDERGVVSAQNLFFTVVICMVGAAALDVTHFYAARSQLQVAADLAAHSALYTARYGSRDANTGAFIPISSTGMDAAKDAAISAATFGMLVDEPDPVISRTDIQLGTYDPYTDAIVFPDDTDTAAVDYSPAAIDMAVATTRRAGGNAVRTYLWRILGIETMDVSTVAVFRLGPGDCDRTQGFFSAREVEVNSNNIFHPGFCIGAPTFTVQQNVEFKPGTGVLVPNCANIAPHGCNYSSNNPGLVEAVLPEVINLDSVLNRVNNTDVVSTTDNDDPEMPGHFVDHAYAYDLLGKSAWTGVLGTTTTRETAVPVSLPPGFMDPSLLTGNLVYQSTCTGNESITLQPSTTSSRFQNFVLITNCQIKFTDGVSIENALLSTINSGGNGSKASFYASEGGGGAILGKDDNCAATGNVALVTRGNYNVAANSNYYGVHIAAGSSVDFQSGGDAEGVLIIAGGNINTQSGNNVRTCGTQADAPARDLSLRLWR